MVVRTFSSVHEAEFASAQLEADGIASRVEDGGVAGVHPWLAPALGGVRLVVDATDGTRASEVLAALDALEQHAPESSVERASRLADGSARRAMTAALLGGAFLPVAMHFYSLLILSKIDRASLTEKGRRHAKIALGVDGVVIAVVAWLTARAIE